MDDIENRTRKNKFEKRRKNTKFISILLVVSVILLIVLIGIWLFGGNNNDAVVDETTQEQEGNIEEETEEETQEETSDESEIIDESGQEEPTTNQDDDVQESDNASNENELVTEEVEPSDDNVSEAYIGNWDPVGTEQEGPHTVTYESGSQDRLEMSQAILLATGLNENDYHEWWIGRGGDQKVIATVSDNNETEVYRVYLSWIDNEGWQPTKVEVLIENDWEKYQ